jgi:formate-dependent nitrite reductase membrane component NrfD
MGFGIFAFLAALDVFLVERGGRSIVALRRWVGVIGSLFAFFIAAYPGVLLGATARPLFVSAHWLGALFLAVGAATGGAAIALILSLVGGRAQDSLRRLMGLTAFALIVEAVALALFLVTVAGAGSAGISRAIGQLLWGPYSLAFWLGAVGIGLVLPLALQFGGTIKRARPGMVALVSVLVLVGGFVVKYVVVAAGQVVLS